MKWYTYVVYPLLIQSKLKLLLSRDLLPSSINTQKLTILIEIGRLTNIKIIHS